MVDVNDDSNGDVKGDVKGDAVVVAAKGKEELTLWEFVELLIFEPIFKFLGLKAIYNTFPTNYTNSYCTTKVGAVCLVFLGFVNSADTILDLATSMWAIVQKEECDNSSWAALLLFVMTLLAGYVRDVNEEIEFVGYEVEILPEDPPLEYTYDIQQAEERARFKAESHEPVNQAATYHITCMKYILMESVVFAIEDGASILFLATRSCTLTPLDWASLLGTFVSFVPIALFLVFIIFATFREVCVDICAFKYAKYTFLKEFLGPFIYSVAFLSFFSYQIIIVWKIFDNRENSSSGFTSKKRSWVLDGGWYTATLSVYVIGVVLIPSCVVTLGYTQFGGFRKKQTETSGHLN